MIGTLLCQDGRQRLIFILGDTFRVSDDVGAEIAEVTPINFRQIRRTRAFIQAAFVDPEKLEFTQAHVRKIREVVDQHAPEQLDVYVEVATSVYRRHPFYEPAEQAEIRRRALPSFSVQASTQRNYMDIPNAFIGRPTKSDDTEITTALGDTANLWKQLLDWLAEQGAADQEWKASSVKYGWSLRLKLKKHTIVYLGPCNGCLRVAFVLGDRAVAAARQSAVSKSTIKRLEEAARYAEGTGLRLMVKAQRSVAATRKLALIGLAN
jgi:hypothetical protein